jgi:hypothetical protein
MLPLELGEQPDSHNDQPYYFHAAQLDVAVQGTAGMIPAYGLRRYGQF